MRCEYLDFRINYKIQIKSELSILRQAQHKYSKLVY